MPSPPTSSLLTPRVVPGASSSPSSGYRKPSVMMPRAGAADRQQRHEAARRPLDRAAADRRRAPPRCAPSRRTPRPRSRRARATRAAARCRADGRAGRLRRRRARRGARRARSRRRTRARDRSRPSRPDAARRWCPTRPRRRPRPARRSRGRRRDGPRADRARSRRRARSRPRSTSASAGSRSSSAGATGRLPANTIATGTGAVPFIGPSLRRHYPEQVRGVGGGPRRDGRRRGHPLSPARPSSPWVYPPQAIPPDRSASR